jgi:hypothetical protein
MSVPRLWFAKFLLALTASLALPACSVNVDKKEDAKKVDIETPMGNLHVSKQVDPRDTGLAVYPGARQKKDDNSGDEKRANVNVSGFGFALKVVAIEFESDDSPEKLIVFYTNELKKYGKLVQCRGRSHGQHAGVSSDKPAKELSCDTNSGDGDTVELKVGTEDNQRIVAIEPKGKITNFALVRVETSGGKRDTI